MTENCLLYFIFKDYIIIIFKYIYIYIHTLRIFVDINTLITIICHILNEMKHLRNVKCSYSLVCKIYSTF
jgi:hypothetical protein